jgi:Holliday junction resolvase-like predicted endonuclease
MIQKSFEKALTKGELGEEIIRGYLEGRGWIVYQPFTKNKAHYFDILATKNKESVIAIDVKTKARLNKWNATGINIKAYNEYLKFINTVNVPFYLIFIDDKNGDVHWAELVKLTEPIYPNEYIIAWSLNQMNFLFKISDEKIKELSMYDQRNYKYNPNG